MVQAHTSMQAQGDDAASSQWLPADRYMPGQLLCSLAISTRQLYMLAAPCCAWTPFTLKSCTKVV